MMQLKFLCTKEGKVFLFQGRCRKAGLSIACLWRNIPNKKSRCRAALFIHWAVSVKAYPSRETYPDSQNFCFDGAKIWNLSISSKYFGTFFILWLFSCPNPNFSPFPLVNPKTFCNFGKISCFSLYKGSLGDWGKTGLRIGDRIQFHILLWNAFNEHPTVSHQPYYG